MANAEFGAARWLAWLALPHKEASDIRATTINALFFAEYSAHKKIIALAWHAFLCRG
jgi:hypothetical protein